MRDLFGNIISHQETFTLFQDEAGCKDTNFFYLGFLLVNNKFGREILNKIVEAKGEKSRESEITFKEIRKDDYRVRIATQWLQLADKWLQEAKIRFFVLGVNKNNLKNFWDNSWSFEKNIYLRFFEIGINSLIGWFSNDSRFNRKLKISHIFYEYGNYNDERKNKIKWMSRLSNCEICKPVYSNPKKQKTIDEKLAEFSNLLQLTDVLLGVTKYSFIRINENNVGKQKCVDKFIDIVERFNDEKKAYRKNSRYYKKYMLQFFPAKNDITKKEFLDNSWESIMKRGGFYCNRPTYRQQLVENKNLKLF